MVGMCFDALAVFELSNVSKSQSSNTKINALINIYHDILFSSQILHRHSPKTSQIQMAKQDSNSKPSSSSFSTATTFAHSLVQVITQH